MRKFKFVWIIPIMKKLRPHLSFYSTRFINYYPFQIISQLFKLSCGWYYKMKICKNKCYKLLTIAMWIVVMDPRVLDMFMKAYSKYSSVSEIIFRVHYNNHHMVCERELFTSQLFIYYNAVPII